MKIVFTFFLIAMSMQTLHAQNSVVKKEIKKKISPYLTKSDSLYIAIKSRLLNDIILSVKSADTASDKNKSIIAKLKNLPKER